MIEAQTSSAVRWDIRIKPWSLITLTITNRHIDELAVSLIHKLSQAPKFFHQTPMILYFSDELDQIEIDTVSKILEILARYKLKVVAFFGKDEMYGQLADFFEVPLLTKALPFEEAPTTEIIETPLRAGMQFFSHGDVISLAPLHPGSEIISEGNIHCYKHSAARLIAGVNGNIKAKVFSEDFYPELISIAGNFVTRSQIPSHYLYKRVMVSLENSQLKFTLMSKDNAQ